MCARRFDLTPVLVIATMLLAGCGDSTSPDPGGGRVYLPLPEPGTAGPEFVTMTKDGRPWVPETSGLYMIGTLASLGWDRYVPGTPFREGMGINLVSFTGIGDYPLSDGTTADKGFYGVSDTSRGSATGTETTPAHPGRVRISGYDPADSTIAGNFRFQVSWVGGERIFFAGSFRIRHPICCAPPAVRLATREDRP